MKRNKLFSVAALSVLLIAVALFSKRLFDFGQRSETVTKHIDKPENTNEVQSGDLIFQISFSPLSEAIQLATHSEYSHCGLIYKSNNSYYVFEAVQPVSSTPLDEWIARGKDGHFVIKRLKNAERVLNDDALQRMIEVGKTFEGKDYDGYFGWSDERIYCSELIWKIYQRATGIEIGKPEKLRDFDLTSEAVKKEMRERYGTDIPLDEKVISPVRIFNSELLQTVKSN